MPSPRTREITPGFLTVRTKMDYITVIPNFESPIPERDREVPLV